MLLIGLLQSTTDKHDLQVVVTGFDETKGTAIIGLFRSSDRFNEMPWMAEKVLVSGNSLVVHFRDVPEGTYAISVIHDANDNGKIDKNFIGIPTEGFGFSNNVMGTFGPPGFSAASFHCPASQPVEIKLRYMR